MNALLASLFASPLAERIGWALVHFLWQGAAVALLLGAALRLLRGNSPQVRWTVSCAALALMAILPVVTAFMISVDARPVPHPLPAVNTAAQPAPSPAAQAPYVSTRPLPPETAATGNAPAPAVTPSVRADKIAPNVPTSTNWARWVEITIRPLLPYIFLFWLAGVVATSSWHIGGWFQLERYKRLSARPAAAPVIEVFDRLVKKLRVRRAIRLIESSRIAAPAVIGWLRPVILLPAAAVTGLTPPQLEAVLAHELAHIRRWDCLVRLVQAAVEILLFYHPAVWWVSSCIRQESECCCDDLAVEVCGDRRGYAEALATVAQMGCRSPQLAAAAGGGNLLVRIRRILEHHRARGLSARSLATSALALGVLFALAASCMHSSAGRTQSPVASQSAVPAHVMAQPVQANAVEGPIKYDATILVPVEMCAAAKKPTQGGEEALRPTISGYPSLEFTKADGAVNAQLHFEYASWPRTQWRCVTEILDADGKSLARWETAFGNSGTIWGIPHAEEKTLRAPLGSAADMSKAAKFRFSIDTAWAEMSNPVRFDEEIPIRLVLDAVEWSDVLNAQWMTLKMGEGDVNATVHVRMGSWPKNKWRLDLTLYDEEGKAIARGDTSIENSGFIDFIPLFGEVDVVLTTTAAPDVPGMAKRYSLRIERATATPVGDARPAASSESAVPTGTADKTAKAPTLPGEWTALHEAARGGHGDLAGTLLDKGADVNAVDGKGRTPLHYAAENGHVQLVKMLLSRKAEANRKDLEGYTPLDLATRGGHSETAQALIDGGAMVNPAGVGVGSSERDAATMGSGVGAFRSQGMGGANDQSGQHRGRPRSSAAGQATGGFSGRPEPSLSKSLPPIEGETQAKPVSQVGDWTISGGHLTAWADSADWSATATAKDGRQVNVQISGRAERIRNQIDMREIEVAGVGKVQVALYDPLMAAQQQRIRPPMPVEFTRVFSWVNGGQAVWVSTLGRVSAPQQASPAGKIVIDSSGQPLTEAQAKEEAFRMAGDDPALALLAALVKENPVLDVEMRLDGHPEVEAAVAGGSFQALARSNIVKQADCAWELPAAPGQKAAFRVTVPGARVVVSGRGFSTRREAGALFGESVWMKRNPGQGPHNPNEKDGWRRGEIANTGVAAVDYGVIKDVQLIKLVFGDGRGRDRQFAGNIYIRGKGENAANRLPDARKRPAISSTDDCVEAILSDLERAYDPDRDAWLDEAGSDEIHWLDCGDVEAVRGADAAKYPHLAEVKPSETIASWLETVFAEEFYASPGGQVEGLRPSLSARETVAKALDLAANSTREPRLWEDLKGPRPEDPQGWHDSRKVYALAVLWEHYPDMRDKNPLERILDYWVTAIAARPAPVHVSGKASVGVDDDLEARGFAVAALHLGQKFFGKQEYARARDAVLAGMRESPANWSWYRALADKVAWSSVLEGAAAERVLHGMPEFVSVYGQTCRFVGEEGELAKVNDWIKAALNSRADRAWRSYDAAKFADRCGMIAALRGRGGYLYVPGEEREASERVPSEVQRRIEQLGSGDYETCQAAVAALVKIGRPAVPAMIELMKQENRAYYGREVLRGMGREAAGALDWLIETAGGATADSRAYKLARWNAIYVLGAMGWAADRVIPVLAEIANDPKADAGVRQIAILSLGETGTSALPVLKGLADAPDVETRAVANDKIAEILVKNGTQTQQEYYTQLIEKDPFDPNVPGYLIKTHTVHWVNQQFENPLTQKVKALYRERLAEKPDAALAWRLAGIIGTGLGHTEIKWVAPTDWYSDQQKREDRTESFVTMAEVLEIGFRHAEKDSDLWRKLGTSLARLRLLQGDWDAMNAALVEMGDEAIAAESRPYLPAPPTDWGKGLRGRWGAADKSMTSGDCAVEFRIEKDGKGLAGAHFLVKEAPAPNAGVFSTGERGDTLQGPDPLPGGFGYGGTDRARTRYAVSDASGLVRIDKLPKIPVKIEVLVPTSNFPEAGRSWSLWMEVEPGVLKLASPSGVGINNAAAIVNLQEGKTVHYPRLVVTPALELNVRNWERVDKDAFELRWDNLDPAKAKDIRYEVEMTLSAPAQLYQWHPVLQSAKETVAGTSLEVGRSGVGGMRLAPGNIYKFSVRAMNQSGEVVAWWPPTPVWTPWPGRESQPPISDRDSKVQSPIFHDIWWRGEFPGHLDTDKTADASLDRFLEEHKDAFEYDYVRVGKAWQTWCAGHNAEARGQFEQLVRELPAGNVVRGTAAALMRQLDAGQAFPKNLEFVPDEAAKP